MIYIRTCAYNAEKTLERAVDSILSQTVGEFTYYILDNGSTDRTGDIIREYAKKDSRIVPFFNKVNRAIEENPDFWEISHKISDNDYFVMLDADDYYDATFLEEMLEFMRKNNLEVAACGTEFFDAESEDTIGSVGCREMRILDSKESWDMFFIQIHWHLRQVWGKVYSAKAARARYEKDFPEWFPRAYGDDTANVLISLGDVERVGAYGKVLHHYAYSKKSVSHRWIDGREKSDVILFEKTLEFLQKKVGHISKTNLLFLFMVYLNAIKDTLEVLAGAQLTVGRKWELVECIFNHPITIQAMTANLSSFSNGIVSQNYVAKYKEAFLEWMVDVSQEIQEEDAVNISKFLYGCNNRFRSMIPQERIYVLLKGCPMLLKSLALGDYEKAFVIVQELTDKSNEEQEYLLELAQNLSALLSKEDMYMMYSKRILHLWITNGEIDKAKSELREWLQIMPQDVDFLKMKERLGGKD